MKLLLNEMWSTEIARQLRRRGFDVVAATELPRRYRGVPDHEFFRRAQEDRRAVVTDNVRDFATLVAERASRAEPHCGVVFAVRPAFDRSHPDIVGDMTRALTSLLSDEPGPGTVVFLRP
jgi:predicted nuclease of predicted toxin-antitoxin system